MGLDSPALQFLLNAKRNGVSFERVLTIGRQGIHISAAELYDSLTRNGIRVSRAEAEQLIQEENGYCEPLLRRLGAGEIHSIDVSPYEGATILHDMNLRLPDCYHGRYTLVVDGGSLEHVFHYPTALANCLEATELGGRFVTITPANNQMGHGFYQLSPELFFRVLDKNNGFKMEQLLIFEIPWRGIWYEVADPKQVRWRVELINRRPAYLIAMAQKDEALPLFAITPQQSDYSAAWQASQESGGTRSVSDAMPRPAGWRRFVPQWVSQSYRQLVPFRPRYYKKIHAANGETDSPVR
jgi:hypothetical protein